MTGGRQVSLGRRNLMVGSLGVVAWSWPLGALADLGSDLLTKMVEARRHLKSLVGPFTQERTLGLLATVVKSQGKLTFVAPDRLRWELGSPDDVVYWVTPEAVAFRTRASQGRLPPKAAGAGPGAAMADLRVLLAGDLRGLEARYEIRVTPHEATPTDPREGGVDIEATPRPGALGALRRITFTVEADLVTPRRARLEEGPKDHVVLTFGALEKNVPVAPALLALPT